MGGELTGHLIASVRMYSDKQSNICVRIFFAISRLVYIEIAFGLTPATPGCHRDTKGKMKRPSILRLPVAW